MSGVKALEAEIARKGKTIEDLESKLKAATQANDGLKENVNILGKALDDNRKIMDIEIRARDTVIGRLSAGPVIDEMVKRGMQAQEDANLQNS